MRKLIEWAPVVRDAQGWYSHPDMPEFDEGDAAKFKEWIDAQGLDVQRVWMDGDAPDLAERYLEGDGDPSALVDWQPTAPGPGWFLLALYDEENDGPVAWFARRSSAAQ